MPLDTVCSIFPPWGSKTDLNIGFSSESCTGNWLKQNILLTKAMSAFIGQLLTLHLICLSVKLRDVVLELDLPKISLLIDKIARFANVKGSISLTTFLLLLLQGNRSFASACLIKVIREQSDLRDQLKAYTEQ